MPIIKLDIDKPIEDWFRNDYQKFLKRMVIVESILNYDLSHFMVNESKGGNVHISICLDVDLCDFEILALQAILGSDYIRETFNLRRIRFGQKNWNLLFDGKAYMSNSGHIKE